MKRILVPTDFSTRSLEALERVLTYTQTVGGELLLLHVVEGKPLRWYAVNGQPDDLYPSGRIDPEGAFFVPQGPPQVVHRDLCQEAEWKLATLLPPQPDCFRALVTVGKAADEIVRVAREQHADLIVMGTQGSRGLRRWLRSSVADRVRRKAAVPVITFDGRQFCLSPAPGRNRVRAQDAADKTIAAPRATMVRGVDQAIQSIFSDEVVGTRPAAGHERPAKSRPPQRVGRLPRRASPRGRGAAEGAQR
ncbi:MAG: universal stress protein [Candidatus Entotheonellia bacterium]